MRLKTASWLAALTVLSVAAVALLATPIGSNGFGLLANRGFIIPEESSAWTFSVLVENEGSGEHWLYGEDRDRYYRFADPARGEPGEYLTMTKEDATRCTGFQPTNPATWCPDASTPGGKGYRWF